MFFFDTSSPIPLAGLLSSLHIFPLYIVYGWIWLSALLAVPTAFTGCFALRGMFSTCLFVMPDRK